MKSREFYLAFCVFFLLSVTSCFVGSAYAQRPVYKQIAMYGSTLPGSWENEEYSAIISRLFISWDFGHDVMEVETIEDCRDRNCAWDLGQLEKSGNRYTMEINSVEAVRKLIITPINPNRLHVRVITQFHDSNNLSAWEYYFARSGGSSRGNSNK
jgi:hypothetical protein